MHEVNPGQKGALALGRYFAIGRLRGSFDLIWSDWLVITLSCGAAGPYAGRQGLGSKFLDSQYNFNISSIDDVLHMPHDKSNLILGYIKK
jgi:hypothetical protein